MPDLFASVCLSPHRLRWMPAAVMNWRRPTYGSLRRRYGSCLRFGEVLEGLCGPILAAATFTTMQHSLQRGATLGLGWRVHSWWAVVVAVAGPAEAPAIVHREQVTLVDDESMREAYHAATAVPLGEAPSLIESVRGDAAAAAEATIRGFVSSLGPVAAVGVVGGNRRLPDLPEILAKHARLHEAERDLYERAIIEGAGRAAIPVTTVPATGALLRDASAVLGVDVESALATLGKSIGPPWQKNYREATAAGLIALGAVA